MICLPLCEWFALNVGFRAAPIIREPKRTDEKADAG